MTTHELVRRALTLDRVAMTARYENDGKLASQARKLADSYWEDAWEAMGRTDI